jgi:hypothetical protein
MPGTLWIASSDLLCVYPDGTEVHVVARLASPTRRRDGTWVSAFVVDGFYEKQEMVGVDSLQALCMAMSMIRALLERFLAQGGRVLTPEDGTGFPLDATFGLMGTAAEPTSEESAA